MWNKQYKMTSLLKLIYIHTYFSISELFFFFNKVVFLFNTLNDFKWQLFEKIEVIFFAKDFPRSTL